MKNEDLIELLQTKIRQAENNAEEAIQEYDNQEDCDKQLAKAEAWQDIIDILKAGS